MLLVSILVAGCVFTVAMCRAGPYSGVMWSGINFSAAPPSVRYKRDFAVFEVGCGDEYCRKMITSLKSLAVQYSGGKWDVWCVVDEACKNILDHELPFGAGMTCNILSIQELISVGAVPNLFRQCASARLWVPEVLTNYKHLFYIDSDTIVTNSIEPALRQMEEQSEVAIFMTEEVVSANCAAPATASGCGYYGKDGNKSAVKAGENGYNSGALGINVDVWNKRRTVDHILWILQEAKEGKFQLSLGDQDILNLLAKKNILRLQDFPCEFNVRSDSQCKDGSGYRTPAILHGNRGIFYTVNRSGNMRTGTWEHAHDQFIQQAHAMLQDWPNEQRLATSLWEASRINVSDLYNVSNVSRINVSIYGR